MLFVSGSNIWTVTQWPGIDPELISSFTTSQMTLNEDPYPLSTTFNDKISYYENNIYYFYLISLCIDLGM